MNKREIEKIRKELEEEREDLLEAVENLKERETAYLDDIGGDDVDKATGDSQREMLFYLSDVDRRKVDSIEDTLQKIDEGRFGICETCGKKISNDRLKISEKMTIKKYYMV
jgi:DnaK suppressor protein